MNRLFPAFFFVALSSVASLALTGCPSSVDALCDARCDCEGCSDYQYDTCLNDADADAARADRLGCADLFDEYAACVDDTGVCHGAEWDTSCGAEHDRLKRCTGDDGGGKKK
jgi:hypothetical protein